MKHFLILFAIVLGLGFPGDAILCQSQTGTSAGKEVAFTRLTCCDPGSLVGVSGANETEQVVIRDQEQWRAMWKRIHRFLIPAPAFHEMDFTKNMLIVVAMGQRPHGGYGIVIERIFEHEGRLEVNVIRRSPRNCITTQAVTFPIDIVQLALPPSTETPVVFHQKDVVFDCNQNDLKRPANR